jgi:PhnB protein
MAANVRPIPEGCHSLTPHLVVRDGGKAMEFYKQAFGAQEVMRLPCPVSGRLMHGEVRIGDSLLFLADEFPEMCDGSTVPPAKVGATTVGIHLYVPDVDAVFNRAVAVGAKPLMPPTDMFWGDRYGRLVDPFGHVWAIATHIEDVTPEECARRAQAAFAPPPAGRG